MTLTCATECCPTFYDGSHLFMHNYIHVGSEAQAICWVCFLFDNLDRSHVKSHSTLSNVVYATVFNAVAYRWLILQCNLPNDWNWNSSIILKLSSWTRFWLICLFPNILINYIGRFHSQREYFMSGPLEFNWKFLTWLKPFQQQLGVWVVSQTALLATQP